MLKEHLLERITTKWWLPRTVESDKLTRILETARLAPSKQGKFNHKIYVLGTSEKSIELKKYLFWEDTVCVDGIRGSDAPGNKRFNGQVNAPIVLVWIAKKYNDGSNLNVAAESNTQRVRDDCIVSATVAMCAAEELGLQTGFCACISTYDFVSKVTGKKPMEADEVSILAMGIGYGFTEPRIHRQVYDNSLFAIPHPNEQAKVMPQAYELILNNKNFIMQELSSWIQQNTVARKAPFNKFMYDEIIQKKCQRDIEIILGAFLHDLQFNSNEATRTVVSYYWNQGKIQLRNPDVEIATYHFLHSFIKNFILVNLPYNSNQTVSIQYINQSLSAEPNAFTKIDELSTIMLDGLGGRGVLNSPIGHDFNNTTPKTRVGLNRSLRPTLEALVKYL
jgi:nitroreductase